MAFDYQTLKNITGASIVASSMATADLAAGSVTFDKIADGNITSGMMQSSSVVLSSGTVTGSLPVGNGGTGLSSLGGAYNVLAANGSNNAFNWVPYGIYGIQTFTGSGTWNRPSYVRYIKVQLVGGGGGGSGHGESGGAGGYAERVLEVMQSGISSVSVSIGGTAGGTFYSGYSGRGSSTSFGPYLSASGGYGANNHYQHCGGLGGQGSGGDINLFGGGGQDHNNRSAIGGDCYFGGAVAAGHPQGGNFSHNHQSHSTPGSGGSGGYFSGHYGSEGRTGMVVVTMYY